MIEDNQTYVDQSFSRLTLPKLDLYGVEFEDCAFSHCDFSEAHFKHCKFIDCTFEQCNLSLLALPHTRFFAVDFKGCKLVGIDWTQGEWPAFHLDPELSFIECLMNDCSFFGLTLHELTMTECKLHEVDFREANLTKATMTSCDFSHSLFMRTQLAKANLSDSYNIQLNVLENNVAQAKFSRFAALDLLYGLGIELVD